MRRGVELSMNVVIIAAIALIVLVILVYLVARKGVDVTRGTGCEGAPGGKCIELASDESCSEHYGPEWIKGQHACQSEYQTCCVQVG